MSSFADLGVSRPVLDALSKRGITAPFTVQKLVIEDVLDGHDVLVQSPTGSGKTLAFAMPLVECIEPDDACPAALVLAPTRELALQIVDETARDRRRARPLGRPGLRRGRAREAGQKGRSRPHRRRHPRPARGPAPARRLHPRRAADPGHRRGRPDARHGLSARPSTGSSPRRPATARRCSSRRRSSRRRASSPAPTPTTRAATCTSRSRRTRRGLAPLRPSRADGQARRPGRRARATPSGAGRWSSCGPSTAPTGWSSGSASTESRQWRCTATRARTSATALSPRFSAGDVDTLVATDVAARGIDVDEITHVINFDAPGDRDAYVHRVGRTARAGRDGAGVTFVLRRAGRRDAQDRTGRSGSARSTTTAGRALALGVEHGLDRGMVTQAELAPAMVVVAEADPQARRGEHVVEPKAAFRRAPGVEDPAHVAAVPAVELAEAVGEVPLGQPLDHASARRRPSARETPGGSRRR